MEVCTHVPVVAAQLLMSILIPILPWLSDMPSTDDDISLLYVRLSIVFRDPPVISTRFEFEDPNHLVNEKIFDGTRSRSLPCTNP